MKEKNFVLMICKRGDFREIWGKSAIPLTEMKEPVAVVRARNMDEARDLLGCSYVKNPNYRSSRMEVEFRFGVLKRSKMWTRKDSGDRIVFTHKFSRFSRVTKRDISIVFNANSKDFIKNTNAYFILEELPKW